MKILIWGEKRNGGPYDVYRVLDNRMIYAELMDNYGGIMNVGNKVWIQGLISELSTDDNELFYYNPAESWEEINAKYDKIVYSAANMLSSQYLSLIDDVTRIFRNSRIPVYVIAIGTQAQSYSDLTSVVEATKSTVSKFMESIYATGGEIACRGYFTKEYLDLVANNTAVVTGCPSLFQNGRQLKINKKDHVSKVVINGTALSLIPKLSHSYVYMDQDQYLEFKYSLKNYNTKKYMSYMISTIGMENAKRFLEGNIEVFFDMADWRKFLIANQYDYSIGSRIHGNIMSLLSGIPSMIIPIDSRTLEMAEFYNIPYIKSVNDDSDINELFAMTDYGVFNRKFSSLFDKYEEFLQKCGLVKKVNQKNIFWNKTESKNQECIIAKRKELTDRLNNSTIMDRLLYKIESKLPRNIVFNEYNTSYIVEKYEGHK